MNLLTLLRTNLYTQKQMGFLLGIKPYRVSELVCLLERRGYIEVNLDKGVQINETQNY